jgi:hypothetical protein
LVFVLQDHELRLGLLLLCAERRVLPLQVPMCHHQLPVARRLRVRRPELGLEAVAPR